jgi:glycerol-3-phosphate acyltransferase PlsY
MARNLLALLASYLLGAVPFGYIIVKLAYGADVRAGGSGSIGATNVTRRAGLRAGLATYVLDVAKGAAAVLLMQQVTDDPLWLGAAATAAIVGHMFPVFLRFKGGKGVATGVGAYLPIVPLAVACALLVWAVIFWRARIVSLASIAATALVPFGVYFWYWILGTPTHPGATAASVAVGCLLIIAKHRENLHRLVAGTELRFERSKRADGTDPAGSDLRAGEAGGP